MNEYKNYKFDAQVAEEKYPEPDPQLEVSGFSKPLRVKEFIPSDAPNDFWKAYFELTEAIYRETNQRGRLPDRETVRRLFSTPNPLYARKMWLATDHATRAVAFGSVSYDTELSPDYESSAHICNIFISVDPVFRRKKIGIQFLKYLIHFAEMLGKNTIRADVDNDSGFEFCKYLRGKRIHKETQHRLYLEDVNWQAIEDWRAKGRSRYPDTKMETFQDCPEKCIREFCSIYTEIINQRPVGEMTEKLVTTPESRRIEERNMKNRGIEWHTMISREPDGQISALTDILYNPQEPYRIHQYFTGVLAKYRRRGLAKRLKAEMLKYIAERFTDAEYVTTTTAKENEPMRAINKQIGFRPTKTCRMFRWTLLELTLRINKVAEKRGGANSLKKKP